MGEPSAPEGNDEDIASIDRAVAALERQRDILGDDVVDTALAPLRERRAAIALRLAGEQRKLVTVLFADLVDFTRLSRRLDAEDTREVVAACFASWQGVITAHGGAVEKFIGDAVMAVFGLQQSREDDAQRAVRAALAMTAELAASSLELTARFGVEVQMRVGVDTGEVVVSTLEERTGRELVAVGPTVNRASRLQAAAPSGGVLISADTHKLIRGRFSLDPRPGLVLKGIDEPVDAFLVVSERPHGFSLDRAGGVEGVETTTVGRELELGFLQERLADVVDEQRWRLVTIVGDAGVGKSRLLLDFDAWLAERPEPVWWFRGRASHSGQNHANALLHDIMASRFQILESDQPDVVRAKFAEGFRTAFQGGASDADLYAQLVAAWLGFGTDAVGAGLPTDPQSLRDQATLALAEYFSRLSRTAPVVILLEDLHWADDGSLRWLDAADRTLHDAQVLVVTTARPALLEQRPRWGEGLDHHVRLQLSPLSGRLSRLLLGQILQRVDSPPASLVELVIQAAEGNPFYIEELVTWLVDTGVIVKGAPSWRVVDELVSSVVVPSTLRGVLQARLDSLSAPERGVLQRASVVGRVFWDEAVVHLDGTADASPAGAVLDGLRGRELVFEREVSAFGSAREFLFKHALLHDVAYEGVLRTHRERYHRLAASWLATVSARSGREREYAALIADHFDRAGDAEAAVWYLRAGHQAAEVFATEEATRLLDRALEIVGNADERLRFDILAEHENVMERIGERSAQEADIAEMGHLATGLDDDLRQVTLLLSRARLAFERSEYDDVLRWATRAAEVAERAGSRERVAEAQLWRGKALTWREDLEAARESLRAARDLAKDLERPWLMGESLRYLSMVANNAGDYPLALELIGESREAFVRDGDIEAESVARAMYGSTCFNMGRVEEAKAVFEQLLPVFRRSGHRYREAITFGNLASIANSQGQLSQSERWCREAVDITRQLADREATATNLTVLGVVEVEVRRWESAERHLAEALELARATASAGLETCILARMAVLALEQGQKAKALTLAQDAVESAGRAPSPLDRGQAFLSLGYAHLALGALADATAAFDSARTAYDSIGRAAFVRECDAGRAAAAVHGGHVDAAVALVRPILDHVDPSGLEDCLRPSAVLHNAWRVLDEAGDPAADRLLADIRCYLLERSTVIGDDEMAAGYLAKPLTAELLALAEGRTD